MQSKYDTIGYIKITEHLIISVKKIIPKDNNYDIPADCASEGSEEGGASRCHPLAFHFAALERKEPPRSVDAQAGRLSGGAAMPKHEFFVDMTCEGCSNAVTRVLNKLGGVQFEIDLPSKTVSIESDHSVDTLLDTLKKTGKNASYIGAK
ncbi:hypothetical protein JRQ81_002536 [Phrynocephalus forsythii]|uniref:Copper transport protein ATOX1 n=1 Tax=Phrynocephalus forsythii TaxID=171643 RepID=A0A9Q0XI61_9SAUR|nr:hypothetical protein JRQ81_002536 [Phrynocephalus forsythii]